MNPIGQSLQHSIIVTHHTTRFVCRGQSVEFRGASGNLLSVLYHRLQKAPYDVSEESLMSIHTTLRYELQS